MRNSVRGALAILLTGALPIAAGSAQEIDPNVIADEIVAAINDGTRTAEYDSATLADGVVTITGFSFEDEPNEFSGSVAEITVADPVMVEEGGFTAPQVTLTEGSVFDGANTLSWDRVELTNAVFPPEADLDAPSPVMPLTAFTASGVLFEPPQANDVVIEEVRLQVGDVVEGVPYTVSIAIDGVEIPMDIADDSEPFSLLQEMGYASLVMDFNIAGTFDAENDTLFADSIGINIRDFGHLDVSGIFSGVPLGMLQAPGGVEEILAAAMVEEVEVRFENTGAMNAFFEVQAELSGVAPEDVAVGLAFVFQTYLQTLENPELEAQVGAAVGAFLRDPRRIAVVADPAESVPLMEVVGLIVSAPTLLPTLLEMVVIANE